MILIHSFITHEIHQKSKVSHIFLNSYFEELTNRSISNLRSVCLMSDNQKEWWIGLPKELQTDIELEE